MKDNLQVGFRLGSADANSSNGLGGNPLSNNSTLQGNGTKKLFTWTRPMANGRRSTTAPGCWPEPSARWTMPFQETPMVFDPDYTPEGGALAGHLQNQRREFAGVQWRGFCAGLFRHRRRKTCRSSTAGSHLERQLDGRYFQLARRGRITTSSIAISSPRPTPAPATRVIRSMPPAIPFYSFNPIVVDASVTYTLDQLPALPGRVSHQARRRIHEQSRRARHRWNWSAAHRAETRVTMSASPSARPASRGTWDIGYRYQSLEANAWLAQIVNDDNRWFYGSAAGSFAGGTNIKGHLFKADYALTDSLLFSFTCYINGLIGNTIPGGASSAADPRHGGPDVEILT